MGKDAPTTVLPRQRSRTFPLRWYFIALILVAGVVNYLDRSTLSIGNTTIAADLELTTVQMGLLLSAFAWPYALANLPAGYLIDRFGPKKMFMAAAVSWSVVTVLTAFADSFATLYLCRVLLGVAESPFFAAGLKASQRWFAQHERSLPVSIINTGSQLGNALAPPLLTFLLLTSGWRSMFIIVGMAGLVVAAIWWFSYRDPRPEEEADIKGPSLDAPRDASVEEAAAKEASWFSLLATRNTWFMILGAFSIFYTVWVFLTWLPGYLETSRGFSLEETGWIAALPYLCGIAGVLAGGALSTSLITRGVHAVTARKIPIVGGAVLAAVAVAPAAYVESTTLSIILLCIGYFAAQIPIGCIWTLASDVAESHQVASLGSIQNFGGFLGAAMAPIITGVVLDRTGTFDLVFVVGGLFLLLGAFTYGVLVREQRPQAEVEVTR
ncbi:MFS transporter [Brachybacterium paraconglomeratum]|uniref:MFS transporter n=1 Tax=Brachybacterium paraconglomeratum TaxID=173362 RepID=UPI003FD3810A